MSKNIIPDDDKKGFTLAFSADDVEYVNPIEYYASGFKEKNKVVTKELLKLKDRFLTSLLSDEFFEKEAEKSWQELFNKIKQIEVPNFFLIYSLPIQKKIKLNF